MIPIVVSVLYLALLECLLSVDNAVALAALVHARLSNESDRKFALRCGILGAYIVRIALIWAGLWLLAHPWVKAIAGAYLIFMAIKELLFKQTDAGGKGQSPKLSSLWRTIVVVEIMDLMFSVDSIAVTLSVSSEFWALVGGAVVGIALMRFAAGAVIKVIDRYPVLEKIAFGLVGLAGLRILIEFFGYLISEMVFAGVMVVVIAAAVGLHKIGKMIKA